MIYNQFHFDQPAAVPLSGNKGEWAEIYIFLKILVDGRIYAADKDLNKLAEKYLKVLRLFREELKGYRLEYYPGGSDVVVKCNDELACPQVPMTQASNCKDHVWKLISTTKKGQISDPQTQDFLQKLCIRKLKSPSEDKSGFFGGTKDIVMEVEDLKGIASTVGFSCKSDFSGPATLFNASKDNTNFLYEVKGPIDDALMDEFNNAFDEKGRVATAVRMQLLKSNHCDIVSLGPVCTSAKRNLIMSGGVEMPDMIGKMLRHYYLDGEGTVSYSAISDMVAWMAEEDVAFYDLENLSDIYWRKMACLLYDMFTGMRMSRPWSGKSSVSGGYIVARPDGEVLAYHVCIADEFKDFLVSRLALEQPSHKRHGSMTIFKDENGAYFLKLPLQVRFRH